MIHFDPLRGTGILVNLFCDLVLFHPFLDALPQTFQCLVVLVQLRSREFLRPSTAFTTAIALLSPRSIQRRTLVRRKEKNLVHTTRFEGHLCIELVGLVDGGGHGPEHLRELGQACVARTRLFKRIRMMSNGSLTPRQGSEARTGTLAFHPIPHESGRRARMMV